VAEEVPISNDEWVVLMEAAESIVDPAARIAAMQAATNDWNGGSMSNALLAKEVSANQNLQATRDNDISRWALGTATEVITDPAGQPSPGYYPIRITRSGSIVWFPSIAKLQSDIAKGDRGAEGASAGEIFVKAGGNAASDPGNGKIKWNAGVTELYIDNLNVGGNDVTAWIDAFSAQPTAVKLQLTIREIDTDKVGTVNVTGDVTNAASFRTVPVTVVGEFPSFSTNARIAVVTTFTSAMMTEVTSATALAVDKAGLANTAATNADDATADAIAATNAALEARDSAVFKAVYATRDAPDGLYGDLAHPASTFGIVYDDATPAYNGTYMKTGAPGAGGWNKLDTSGGLNFQQLPIETGYVLALVDNVGRAAMMITADGSVTWVKLVDQSIKTAALKDLAVTRVKLADGVVDLSKLDTSVSGLIPQAMDPSSNGGFVWALIDANGRYAIAVKDDGSVYMPKFVFPDGSVTRAKLDQTNVAPFVPQYMNPADTGFVWALADAGGRYVMAVTADGSIVMPKFSLPAGSVTKDKLDQTNIAPFIAQYLDPAVSGFVWALSDPNGRYAIAVKQDGTFIAPKLLIANGTITDAMLSVATAAKLPQTLSAESGYIYAVVDATGRIGFGIKIDGTVVGKIANALTDGSVTTIKMADGAVTETKLEKSLQRLAVPHVTDRVPVMPDAWRATLIDLAVRTSIDGSFWEDLPHSLTRNIRGVNGSGTSLQFRRSEGLPMRGKRYINTFAPGALVSSRERGTLVAGSTYPPAPSSPLLGDYYAFRDTNGATLGSDTFIVGDLSVYDGSGWTKQAAPAPNSGGYGGRQPGDWWAVTGAGTFDGVTYAIGDRIVYVGGQAGGGPVYARWVKGDYTQRGELFYRGEIDAAAGGSLPASPLDGDVYQASTAGTIGGVTLAIGDYLVREAGVWGTVPTEPIKTVASGAFISLACRWSSAEWQVRRTDKSATRAAVSLKSRRQSAPKMSRYDVVVWGDSMPGAGNFGPYLATKLNRTVAVNSYGGGVDVDVLSMMQYEIARLGDRYAASVHLSWSTQNNTPESPAGINAAQARETKLRQQELIGARDGRILWLSVLGTRNMTWNGTRLVADQLELAFGGTGALVEHEDWLNKAFPGQWISPRLILLAAAVGRTTPDPQFPGKTEEWVAANYGIVPYSFYGGAGLPVPAASLNYVGTYSTAGLPSGGSANDYYIRTGGAVTGQRIGDLIINVAGVWTEYVQDTVHLGNAGGDPLTTGVAAKIEAMFY
jgi:hypothetical protein